MGRWCRSHRGQEFENELLGLSVSGDSISGAFISLKDPSASPNVSYSWEAIPYGESKDFIMESSS